MALSYLFQQNISLKLHIIQMLKQFSMEFGDAGEVKSKSNIKNAWAENRANKTLSARDKPGRHVMAMHTCP